MHTPRIALLLALPALALGACGGDSDEDKIRSVIQDVAKDSATLCDHATDKLFESFGADAEQCRQDAKENPDDSSEEIKGDIDVTVDGDKATAKFTDNEGEDQTVKFVKDGDDWKIDAVE